MRRSARREGRFTFLMMAGAAAMMAYRPWQEAAFFCLGYVIVFVLLEIRSKLEAIRFMMAMRDP